MTISGNNYAEKTIIFVHGIGWHGGFYYPLLNLLKEAGFRTIAIDLRGHGRSHGERGQHLYEELLEDVFDIVDYTFHTFGENVYLFGSSFGASVAYYAAIKTSKIKDLILNNAWDITNLPSTINRARMHQKLSKFTNSPKKMISLFVMMGLKMSWSLFDNKLRFFTLLNDKYWHKKWSVQSWKSFLNYKPSREDELHFNKPVLVITGEKDGMLPLSYTQKVYEQLSSPKKELAVIDHAGHMIMIEHLDRAEPIITKWLRAH